MEKRAAALEICGLPLATEEACPVGDCRTGEVGDKKCWKGITDVGAIW